MTRRQAIIWTNDGRFTDTYIRGEASDKPIMYIWNKVYHDRNEFLNFHAVIKYHILYAIRTSYLPIPSVVSAEMGHDLHKVSEGHGRRTAGQDLCCDVGYQSYNCGKEN